MESLTHIIVLILGVRKTGIDINHFICYNKANMEKKFTDFEIEEKTSGGAVYEAGVRESKRSKAVRQIAQPLMDKYWKQDVTNLHRIYRVAEYLLQRRQRHK